MTALIERYERDVDAAETKRAQQETEIHDTDALLEETERLLATKQSQLLESTERATNVRSERDERERALQTLELAISKGDNRLADLETEISGTSSRRAATPTCASSRKRN